MPDLSVPRHYVFYGTHTELYHVQYGRSHRVAVDGRPQVTPWIGDLDYADRVEDASGCWLCTNASRR